MDARLELTGLHDAARSVLLGLSHGGARRSWSLGSAPPSALARFRIASLTKPVTAVATVLAARGAGVSLDTPVVEILPSLRADWVADPAITVSHALAQVSGLSGRVTAAEVAALGEGDDVALAAARLVGRAGSVVEPGRRWRYDNGNYFLAGAVAAELAGTTYEQALSRFVLRPWGLDHTGFAASAELVPGVRDGAELAPMSYPRGRRPSGGLCSTAGDLLTFSERLLADDALLGEVATARTPPSATGYGFGWELGPHGQLYLNGRLPGYRAALLAIPRHQFAAVALTNDEGALPAAAAALSALQQDLTGDDLSAAINDFAA